MGHSPILLILPVIILHAKLTRIRRKPADGTVKIYKIRTSQTCEMSEPYSISSLSNL